MKISIITNLEKRGSMEVLREVIKEAEREGIKVQLLSITAEKCGRRDLTVTREEFLKCDTGIVIGGDGTLLNAVQYFAPAGIPLAGIYIGGLGFLMEFKTTDIKMFFKLLKENKLIIDERLLLEYIVKDKKGIVLNEVVIKTGEILRIVKYRAYLGKELIGSFRAEGILIATPTGSTAYSLSAGGPLVIPQSNLLILTPLCPHSLHARPIVFPANGSLKIIVDSDIEPIFVAGDGRKIVNIHKNDSVLVKSSDIKLKLLRLPDRSFFDILREKFNWV